MTVMTAPPGVGAIAADRIPGSDDNTREGITLRAICFSDETGRRNIMAAVATLAADMVSPRHQHTFDQLRYYIDGDTQFADEVYQPGDCVYFPEGVAYGPQSGRPGSNCLHVALQWGGPTGIYYPTQAEQRAARAELAQRGTFKGGLYTYADGRTVDGFEALLEHLSGAPCAYPQPRYDRPVRMRTGAYAEQAVPDVRGVTVRRLGAFNESGPEVVMLRIAAGARVPAGRAEGDELRIVISGTIDAGGDALGGIAFLYAPHGATKPVLEARTPSEVLSVRYNIPFRAAL